MTPLAHELAERIRRHGPLPFADFVDAALYHPEHGFYTRTGRAGRRGDFLTSPEVGPLFGTVLAAALDRWWRDLGRPSPFTVVELGAGPGTLARSVLAADPAPGALDYVAVETSAVQRGSHPDGVRSVDRLPTVDAGVVLANEFLDNVPFDVVAGGSRLFVGVEDDRFVEVWRPGPPDGPRRPDQSRARDWVDAALAAVGRGRVVVVDYVRPASDFEAGGWLRTYRGHERGTDPLVGVGEQDITTDVDLDQIAPRRPDSVRSQAEFLRSHGIDDLVAEGLRVWSERAAIGDLAALAARSRLREAEALCDPAGLGAFTVAEWIL